MVNYLKMYMCVDNFYLYFIFWKKNFKNNKIMIKVYFYLFRRKIIIFLIILLYDEISLYYLVFRKLFVFSFEGIFLEKDVINLIKCYYGDIMEMYFYCVIFLVCYVSFIMLYFFFFVVYLGFIFK